MRIPIAVLRAAVAAAILAAVLTTFVAVSSAGPINPANFFGFFTLQSNLLFAASLALTAGTLATGRGPAWIPELRACLATYLVIVGLIYAVLLAPLGAAGGVPVPWANAVLHLVTPIFAIADWLIAPDRRRLGFRLLLPLLVYPLLWVAVVLIRGATDGWVPYPFLDPATGYPAVAGYVALIAALFAGVGALVVWSSRLPLPGGAGREAPRLA